MRSITIIHHHSIGYDDTSANSLFSTCCRCQRHSHSGLDEGFKQATMTTQPSSSNEQWATCFDWVITFHVDRVDVRLSIFYYRNANVGRTKGIASTNVKAQFSDQYFSGPFRSDRRRRVGEYSRYSTTWELISIVRDDLSLYSRGIIHTGNEESIGGSADPLTHGSLWQIDPGSWASEKRADIVKSAGSAQTLFLCGDFFWVDTSHQCPNATSRDYEFKTYFCALD
jgi:hypothetical protein